jgi:serine/threonine-protein kinase
MTVLGGRYRVLRPLGSGGSAEVYLAEQLSLNRKVALKVITRKGPVQPEAQARFKREALIHSSIEHPSVVRILDFETDGPEGTVVVLEFVEGVRLDEAVAGHPMEPREASRLLLQLAEGLAAIHGKGVVHRDFKAENVMLSDGPEGKHVRILDFGLARIFDADLLAGDGRSFVSSSGMVAATPAYAAPEQLRGLPADPRTDVYGFGITAFYMLTGTLPFNGPEVHDFVTQHTEKKPPALRGEVPDELAELVERCLEKEPSRRPADGAALVSMLSPVMPVAMEDILPPTVMSAAAVPAFTPAAKRRRNPLPLLAMLLSLVAGAAPFFAVEQPWRPEAQARLLLRAGQPGLALERLEREDAPAVRALVLEALGRQDELTKLLKDRCVAVVSGLLPVERGRLEVSFAACAK